ncbi:hypothetical protein M8C21_001233, partial [Ambrosia artemisiifolia]
RKRKKKKNKKNRAGGVRRRWWLEQEEDATVAVEDDEQEPAVEDGGEFLGSSLPSEQILVVRGGSLVCEQIWRRRGWSLVGVVAGLEQEDEGTGKTMNREDDNGEGTVVVDLVGTGEDVDGEEHDDVEDDGFFL